ncbi:unnamed protein product [Brachionus calyciflorus]|uniref:G-protein coupled receptors family 2 profile 2 domain-containing protein n=1 Tax=Brachionus calyciflorus TaxID=104777 RepID=A0A813YU78_9BILA|nr:unnamed protein product [Brachionus calyciflorus]
MFKHLNEKKLQVNRIRIHKHFFISLLLHSIVQIIWDLEYLKDVLNNQNSYMSRNHHGCILFALLLHYTRLTNYFWMFNESFYLFMLLFAVFKDQSSLKMYFIFGWGVPFIICSIYAILSAIYADHGCWLTSGKWVDQIIILPNVIILFLNLLFLIVIIRLLYKALKSSKRNEIDQYKKSFKATIILVPLFGLHYLFSPVLLCESTFTGRAYNLFNKITENLQGFFVSLLFCFFNNEVKQLLKKSVKSRLKTISLRDLTITFTRNEYSLPSTESNIDFTSRNNSIQKESLLMKN